MEEQVILINENDEEIGREEKLEAHKKGKLHRAFSILIFNSQGKLLLQKRNKNKYHCPRLWTNTCCSHPRPDESLEQATHRRLLEEMGFDCEIEEKFKFFYKVKFNNGLIENECDHVFIGKYDKAPLPNPNEVDDWKWISMKELKKDISENPSKYTEWFKIILKEYFGEIDLWK